MQAPSTPQKSYRRQQYQQAPPSRQEAAQYGVANQPGGMTGIVSNADTMPPPPLTRQPTNTTTTATTTTTMAINRRQAAVAASTATGAGGATTAGATETAGPLADKPKGKRKDKVPRIPPPSTISDFNSKKTYTRGSSLGEGGFASCYELIDQDDGTRFAAKVIQKSELSTQKTRHKLFAEIKIHQNLRHVNIVQYYNCFEDDNFVYLLMELCECKTLMDLLKRRKVVTEPEARFYMKEIVSACVYLHEEKVIHRDLKLGNIFLSHDMHIKVGDFGLAAVLLNADDRKRTICGTPNYIAPEILFETSGHSFEVDIWSLGCIMYTLLIGKPPFQTNDVKSIYKNIRELNYSFPPDIPISKEAKALIAALLSPKPEQRPNINNILKDPFFTNGYCPESVPRSSQHTKPKYDNEISAFQQQKRQARQNEERQQQQAEVQMQQRMLNHQDAKHGPRPTLPTPTALRQPQKMGMQASKRAAAPPPAHLSANRFGFGEEVRMEMIRGDQVTSEVRTVNVQRPGAMPPPDQFSGSQLQQEQMHYSMPHRQSSQYPQHDHLSESPAGLHRQTSQSSSSRTMAHSHSLSHQQQPGKPSRDALWQARQGQFSLSNFSAANQPSSASMSNAHGSSAPNATNRPQRPLLQHSSATTVAQRSNGPMQSNTGSNIPQSRLPMAKARVGQGMSSPMSSPRFGSLATMNAPMPGTDIPPSVAPNMEYPQDIPSSPRATNHMRRMSSDLTNGGRINNSPFSRPPMQSQFNQPANPPFNDVQRTTTFGGARTLPSNTRLLKLYREQPVDESMDMDMEVDKSMEAFDDDEDDDRFVQRQNAMHEDDGQMGVLNDQQERGFQPSQRASSGSTFIQTVTGVERPASAMKRTYRSGHPSLLQSSQSRSQTQSGPSSIVDYPSKLLQDIHMHDNTEEDIEPPQVATKPSSQPFQPGTPTRAGFSQGHGRHSSQHVPSSQLSPFSQHSRNFSQQASQVTPRSTSSRPQQGAMNIPQSIPSSQFSQPFASQPFSTQPIERSRSEQGGATSNDEWHPTLSAPLNRGAAAVGPSAGLERARTLSQHSHSGGEVGPLDTPPTTVVPSSSSSSSLARPLQSSASSSRPITNLAAFMPPERVQRREQMYNESDSSDMMDRDVEHMEEDAMEGRAALVSSLPNMGMTPAHPPTDPRTMRATVDHPFGTQRRRSSHLHELHRPRPEIVQGSRQQLQQQRLLQQKQEQQEQQQQRRLQMEQDQLLQQQKKQQEEQQQTVSTDKVQQRLAEDALVPIKRKDGEVEEFEVAVKFENGDNDDLVPNKQDEETLHNPSDRPLQETTMSGHSGEQDHVEVPSTSGGATSLSLSITADKAMGPLESVHKYLGLMLREHKLGRFPSAYSTYAGRPIPAELLVLPSPIPTCYVVRWCDYSQSYGTGFGTVNGVTGVLFNDGWVGLLSPNDINVEFIVHPNSSGAIRSRRSRSSRSRRARESGAESGSASDNPSGPMTESTSSLEGGNRGNRKESKHRGRTISRSVSRGGVDKERRPREMSLGNNKNQCVDGATLVAAVPSENATGATTTNNALLHKKKPSLTLKKEGSSMSSPSMSFSSPTTPLATPTTAVTGGDEQTIAITEGDARPSTEWEDAARASWMTSNGGQAGGTPTMQEALQNKGDVGGSAATTITSPGETAVPQQPDQSFSVNLRKRQYHGAEDDAYEERLKGRRSVIGRRTGTTDTETDGDSDQEAKHREFLHKRTQKPQQQPAPLLTPLITMGGAASSPWAATSITASSPAAFTGGGGGGGGGGGNSSGSNGSPKDRQNAQETDLAIGGGMGAELEDESEESWDEEDAHAVLKSAERHCYTRTRCRSPFRDRNNMLPQFRNFMLRQKLDVPLTMYKDLNLISDMPFMSGFYQVQQNLLILRLSDGTVQVNFEDHEKLVFSDHGRALIYIKTSKRIFTMSLKNALLGIIFERQSSKSTESKKSAAATGLFGGPVNKGSGSSNSSMTTVTTPTNGGSSRPAAALTLTGLDPPSPNPSVPGVAAGSPQLSSGQLPKQQQSIPSPVPATPSTQQPQTPATDTYRGIILGPKEHKELINKLKTAYRALQQLARVRKVRRKQRASTGQQALEEIIITKKKEEAERLKNSPSTL